MNIGISQLLGARGFAGPFFDADKGGGAGSGGGTGGSDGGKPGGTDGSDDGKAREDQKQSPKDTEGDSHSGGDGHDGGDARDGQKSEGGEGKPGASPEPVALEQIKIPEGSEYDKELGASFLGVVNELGLSVEGTQRLADLYFKTQGQTLKQMDAAMKAAAEESAKAAAKERADEEAAWLEECKADAEIGGQKWDASQAKAAAAIRALKAEGAYELFTALGITAHPDVMRLLVRAGEAVGEDRMGGGREGGRLDHAKAIFGNSLQKGRM